MKHFLNQFHLWRFHIQLYDALNNKFCFHFSYQQPGYWINADSPEAKRAFMLDDELELSAPKPKKADDE